MKEGSTPNMEETYTYTDMLAYFGITVAHPGGRNITEKAIEHLPITNGSKIAEIGCGVGDTASWLTKSRGANVFGIDQHLMMIQKARKRHGEASKEKKLHFLHSSAESIPFPDNSLDGVIAESVLSFTNVHHVLKEVKRIIRPGGFFASLDLVRKPSFPINDKDPYLEFYGLKQMFTLSEWTDLFESYGFRVTDKILEDIETKEQDIPELVLSQDIPIPCYEIMEKHIQHLEMQQKHTSYAYFICKVDASSD
ncbi:class I SAM-dependent methyltransferase [Alteribacter populi]|uniref:class I SAM-dependent methyltransferase n=1 Tax=Alteribacter populi TaxID=2011011 RepID=UPI000BBB00A4|nr:class I SAM-dependent methyltransferase [Alteribacter populi]